MRRYLVSVTVALLCVTGVAIPAAAASTAHVRPAAAASWGKAQVVPGLAALTDPGGSSGLNAMSCSSPGNCGAGGYYQYDAHCCGYDNQAFVVNEVNGVWGHA